MLGTIDEVSSNRWDAAVKRAAAQPGHIRPEKIKALTDSFAREVTAAGAAAGVVAASRRSEPARPCSTATAELAWFTARAGDLILTIAALHGRPDPTVDERRAWLLAVLIYGGSARDEFARAVNEASTGMVAVGPERRLPLGAIQLANGLMSRALFRRYGTRRGVAARRSHDPARHRRRDRRHRQLHRDPLPRPQRRRVLRRASRTRRSTPTRSMSPVAPSRGRHRHALTRVPAVASGGHVARADQRSGRPARSDVRASSTNSPARSAT